MRSSLLAPTAAGPRLATTVLADMLAGLATAESLWRPHVAHDAYDRARIRLLATPAYEVWLLGWTPGQSVGLHDHGDANGAFAVVDGELVETSLTSFGLVDEVLATGDVGRVPAGAIHDVSNRSARNATSLHVYSRPLRAMGFFRADGELIGIDAVQDEPPVIPSGTLARALHPAGVPWR